MRDNDGATLPTISDAAATLPAALAAAAAVASTANRATSAAAAAAAAAVAASLANLLRGSAAVGRQAQLYAPRVQRSLRRVSSRVREGHQV